MLLEEHMLKLQEEEYLALNRELQRKLTAEKMEIERLRGEISDYQQIFKYNREQTKLSFKNLMI